MKPWFWRGEKPEHEYLEYTCRFPMAMTKQEFTKFIIAIILGLGWSVLALIMILSE